MPRIEHIIENDLEKKRCGKCKSYKDISVYFGKSKSTWDGLRPTCKECLKEDNKSKKKERSEYNKKYWEKTKDKQKEKNKIWRENNKEYVKTKHKEWRKENGKEADKRQWQKRKYDEVYKKKHNEYIRKWCKNKRKTDVNYKVIQNCRRRIREILTNSGLKKDKSTLKYTGCTLKQLIYHLEKQFQDGMTWENYGKRWHIDHIIPCTAFDMKRELQKRICFYYKNLQPLWSCENIKKSNEYNENDKQKYIKNYLFHVYDV